MYFNVKIEIFCTVYMTFLIFKKQFCAMFFLLLGLVFFWDFGAFFGQVWTIFLWFAEFFEAIWPHFGIVLMEFCQIQVNFWTFCKLFLKPFHCISTQFLALFPTILSSIWKKKFWRFTFTWMSFLLPVELHYFTGKF